MSLIDEARALTGRPGGVCGVARLLSTHPELEDDVAKALIGLKNQVVSAQGLSDAFKARGIEITGQVLGRHNRGECSCR